MVVRITIFCREPLNFGLFFKQFSQQFYYMFHLPIAKCIANQYVQYVWTCGCLSWIAMKLICTYMNSPPPYSHPAFILWVQTGLLETQKQFWELRFLQSVWSDFWDEKRQNVWKTLLPIRNDTGGPTFNVLKAGKC